MIKFFRKIRQKLLVENRFNKYLLYAIGEIVLVVIGILIALYINNNNEQRKKDRDANKLLIQIQDDLLSAAGTMGNQRESYKKKDSIYRMIASDTLTVEDMMNPKNYEIHRFTFDYYPYVIPKEGYNSFVNKIDQFSEKYTNLEPELKSLYSEFVFFYDISQKKIEEVLERQYDYARSQKWYSNVWNSQNLSPEFVDYLLNDYRYKNEARTYDNYIFTIVGVTMRFQMKAVNLYKQLHAITQQPKELPDLIKNFYSNPSKEYYDELVGTYVIKGGDKSDILKIEFKDEQLYINDNIAFVKTNGEIIVDNYPIASIWIFDDKNKTIRSRMFQDGRIREKIDD